MRVSRLRAILATLATPQRLALGTSRQGRASNVTVQAAEAETEAIENTGTIHMWAVAVAAAPAQRFSKALWAALVSLLAWGAATEAVGWQLALTAGWFACLATALIGLATRRRERTDRERFDLVVN